MSLLSSLSITVRYGTRTIVDRISFDVNEGDWLMIIGPNGAGKSTLVKAISQYIPHSGTAAFMGRDLRKMRPAERARAIGVLSQTHTLSYSFSVEEVVRLGRYAHSHGIFGSGSPDDDEHIKNALKITGLDHIARQSVLTLSGGEQQRTFLAQVLAQDPHILILDEPTNHLDMVYRKQMLDIISEWVKEPGRAVISVMHDLSLAKAYGNRALLMDRAQAIAQGSIEDVFSPENINRAYSLDVSAWMRSLLGQWG